MNKTEKFNELYLKNNPDSVQNFEFHFGQQFQGIDFENKKILEIGCGKGFLSLYIACFKNPAEVIALDEDEGEGSDLNVLDMVTQNIKLLELDNIKIVKNDYEWDILLDSFIEATSNQFSQFRKVGYMTLSECREFHKKDFKF